MLKKLLKMSKENPLVSVVMPAYNAEKYISEAIESILNQTFQDFEFVIIDDGSTDRTWEIIQEYAKKDERIISVRNEINLNVSQTRNKGIDKSRGKYIVWADSDDISLPHRIEKQLNFMESNEGVGLCGSFMKFFGDSEKESVRKYSDKDEILRKLIFRQNPVAQPACIMRIDILKKSGGYPNLSLSEDLYVFFKMGEISKFSNIQEVLVRYRVHAESLTSSKLKSMELNTIKIRKSFSKSEHYIFSVVDVIYNFIQFVSIYVLPPKLKIKLFSLIRNS